MQNVYTFLRKGSPIVVISSIPTLISLLLQINNQSHSGTHQKSKNQSYESVQYLIKKFDKMDSDPKQDVQAQAFEAKPKGIGKLFSFQVCHQCILHILICVCSALSLNLKNSPWLLCNNLLIVVQMALCNKLGNFGHLSRIFHIVTFFYLLRIIFVGVHIVLYRHQKPLVSVYTDLSFISS